MALWQRFLRPLSLDTTVSGRFPRRCQAIFRFLLRANPPPHNNFVPTDRDRSVTVKSPTDTWGDRMPQKATVYYEAAEVAVASS